MAGESEQIRYVMTVDGGQQTAASFENAAKSIKRSDDALKAATLTARAVPPAFSGAAKVANDNAHAFDNVAKSGQRLTPVLGALGSAVAGLSPELGAMGAAFGRAGGAMAGMTALIGGAGGVAAGGLVAALGLLSTYMKYVKSDSEKMADAIDLATSSMERARRVDARSPAAAARRRAQGLAIAGNLGDGSTDPGFVGTAGNRAALEEIAALEATGDIGPDVKAGRRSDVEFETMQRRDALDKQLRHLYSLDNEPTLDQRAEAGKSHIERRKAEFEEISKASQQTFDETLKSIDETESRYGELGDKGKEVWMGIGSTAAGALSAIARGQKVTLKEIMASIGAELVGKGVMWAFEGSAKLASSYGTDPAGWELLGIGAAATAAGLGMGAEASAGSSNRGGSVSRPRGRADDPMYRTDTTGGRSDRPINVYMPTVVSPTAQDGQRVKQALAEADRQGLAA